MAKRPVSAQELAAVASRFNGTPVVDKPREFDFPDTASFDAWNKAVDRLEAGETLASVLGDKPSRSTTGAAPLDAAVGFVGGLAHQILDPAIQASRALLPSGMGVEAAAERLGGDRQALTESDLYKKATYVPETTAGTLGAYAPVIAGTATGIATEGAVPTALTLGGALLGQKSAEVGAEYIASQPTFALTPEQIEAWRGLAGTAGMVAGGAGAHRVAPKVTVPEAIQAVKNAPSAVSERAKQRVAASVVLAKRGYNAGGYAGLVSGAVSGALKPELVNLSEKTLLDIARGKTTTVPETTPSTPKPAPTGRVAKPAPTLGSRRQQDISEAIRWAVDAKTKEQISVKEATDLEKLLGSGLTAAEVNGIDIDPVVFEQYDRVRKVKASVNLPSLREEAEILASQYGDARSVAIARSPEKSYAQARKIIEGYADAGEQPPVELVDAHDLLRERLLRQKGSISIEAHDAAIQALTEAATKGPIAYDQARAAIAKDTLLAIERGPDRGILAETKRLSRRLNGSPDNPVSNATLDALRESTRPPAARDANLKIVDAALDHAFGMADVAMTLKEASDAEPLYRQAIDALQSEQVTVPDVLTKGLARAEERLGSTAKRQPATVEDPLLAQRNDIIDKAVTTARRFDAIGSDERLTQREAKSAHTQLLKAIDTYVAMDMPVPDVVSRQFQRLDNMLRPAEGAELVPENVVLASRQKTESRLLKMAADLDNVKVDTSEAKKYIKPLRQLKGLLELQEKPVPSSVAERIAALEQQIASESRASVKKAKAPEKPETPAQTRVRERRGYSTRLPRQHNATTLSAAARLLQLAHDITAIRDANPKALKSVVKDATLDSQLAEFERLARLFAGRDKVEPFATTRNIEDIPNVGTVNGWISNATNFSPFVRKSLGLKD